MRTTRQPWTSRGECWAIQSDITVVGINGDDGMVDGEGNVIPGAPLYVEFNYDNYGGEKIIVRGVRLIDYTPGGPDFMPE